MFVGNSSHLHILENNSLSEAINSGGILQSPGASIGDNPTLRVVFPRHIQETHYDSFTHSEL